MPQEKPNEVQQLHVRNHYNDHIDGIYGAEAPANIVFYISGQKIQLFPPTKFIILSLEAVA